MQDPALIAQSIIQWGARKRGHECNLHIKEPARSDKLIDGIETFRSRTVEPHNETTVNRDAMTLDRLDGPTIIVELPRFPIRSLFNPVQGSGRGAFEPDQHLGATGIAHQSQ